MILMIFPDIPQFKTLKGAIKMKNKLEKQKANIINDFEKTILACEKMAELLKKQKTRIESFDTTKSKEEILTSDDKFYSLLEKLNTARRRDLFIHIDYFEFKYDF